MCLSLKSHQLSEYSICEKLYMFTKRKLKKHRTLSNMFCWKLRLCFWHCLKAANDYAKWSKIADMYVHKHEYMFVYDQSK